HVHVAALDSRRDLRRRSHRRLHRTADRLAHQDPLPHARARPDGHVLGDRCPAGLQRTDHAGVDDHHDPLDVLPADGHLQGGLPERQPQPRRRDVGRARARHPRVVDHRAAHIAAKDAGRRQMSATSTLRDVRPDQTAPIRGAGTQQFLVSKIVTTAVLVLGALYCLVPIAWVVIAATKSRAELFSTFTMAPGTGLFENIAELFAYEDGGFLRWAGNSLIYSGVGALACTIVSAAAGYGLAKYRFRGRAAMMGVLLAGVLVPGITLAIPQYMVLANLELANTYWSVLLPSVISPFAIYLS